MAGLNVNTADLTQLGNEMQSSARDVEGVIKSVTDNLFGLGTHNGERESGRAYQQQGKGAHDALEKVGIWLQHWSAATKATGAALGKSAFEYEYTDDVNAKETNQT
ncbi:hypothetical protein ACFQZZ_30975 [Nocardia sp. GCM10030253]|uniref:hypothetical protein n=1 Tax=Nocardia sp. GCM10030253 TaxID=3273404 RepID=UPI003628BB62